MESIKPVAIVMFLWGDEHYGANDVNVLVQRVYKLSSRPFKIFLITDRDRSQIDERVCQLRMPERFCQEKFLRSGKCQAKISLFEKDLLPAGQRCVYIDIDSLLMTDPTVGPELCPNPNKIYILPSTLLPVGFVGRVMSWLTNGRRFPRGNSSVMVFTSGLHDDIADSFIHLYDTVGEENFKPLIVDDRFISWAGRDRLEPMPRSFAASIRRVFMTRFTWLGWLRAALPWVTNRRENISLITLDDPAVKLEELAKLSDGNWIQDRQGRKLLWSRRWMGETFDRLTGPDSQLNHAKPDK